MDRCKESSDVWWHRPLIPALGRLRLEKFKLKAEGITERLLQ